MNLIIFHIPGLNGMLESISSIRSGMRSGDKVFFFPSEERIFCSVMNTFAKAYHPNSLDKSDSTLILSDGLILPPAWRQDLEATVEGWKYEWESFAISWSAAKPLSGNPQLLAASPHFFWVKKMDRPPDAKESLVAWVMEHSFALQEEGTRIFRLRFKGEVKSARPFRIPFEERWNILKRWSLVRKKNPKVVCITNSSSLPSYKEVFDEVLTPAKVKLPTGLDDQSVWEFLYRSACEKGADWICFLKEGERLDPRLDKKALKSMLSHMLRPAFAVRLKMIGLHGSLCRMDGKFGITCEGRIFRPLRRVRFIQERLSGIYVPDVPPGSRFPVPYVIEFDAEESKDVAHVVPYEGLPTVGLVAIAKDEEDNLATLLESCYTYFSEKIVVVDSRTTDRTREVAKLFGCKVFDFEWCDDFSKMRNFGLSRCEIDYVMHLDADEEVEMLEVIYLLMLKGADAYLFPVANHHPNGTISYSDSFRLFKNDGLVYSGRCHETIEDALHTDQRKTEVAPIMIQHFGYRRPPEYVDRKIALYEKLNDLRIEENPADPRPYFDKALERLNRDDVEGALELLQTSKRLGPKSYLPRKELGLVYLRLGLRNLKEAVDLLPSAHPMKRSLSSYVKEVEKVVEPPLYVGTRGKREVGDST